MWKIALASLLLVGCPDGAASDGAASDGAASDGDSGAGTDSGTGETDWDDDTAHPSGHCDESSTGPETFLAEGEVAGITAGEGADCWSTRVVGAGTVNMVETATMADVRGSFYVTVTDPAGSELAPRQRVEAGGSFSFQLWQSGEFFVDFEPDEHDGRLSVTFACTENCDREYTRYPIVMLHGLGGAGVFDGVDYYYEVRDDLEARGYLVRNPSVEPFAGSDERAEQWAEILAAYESEGLGRKFNLIAHSQGGLDARYLVSALGWGDRIAALDMVATPNHGTEVADVLTGVIDDGTVDAALVDLGTQAFADLMGLGTGDQSLTENMAYLTTENIAAFNEVILDDSRVYYSSWAGVTCGSLEPTCQDEHGGEAVELLLEPLYLIMWAQGLESDGMVPLYSPEWGEYQGQINADHADEIGQFADEDNPAFDHRAFYLSEVRRLAGLGF